MNKLLITILLLFSFCCSLQAQVKKKDELKKLLAKLPGAKEDADGINLLYDIGVSFDNIDSSIRYIEASLALSDKLKYNEGRQQGLYGLTYYYYGSGNTAKGLEKMRLMDDSAKVRTWWELADYFKQAKGFVYTPKDSVQYCLQQALQVAEKVSRPYYTSECLYKLAHYYYRAGNIKEGHNYAMRAEQWLKKADRRDRLSFLWFQPIKFMDTTDNNLPEMLFCYDKCMQAYFDVKDTLRASFVLTNEADLLLNQGKVDEAIANCNRVIALQEQIKFKQVYYIYSRLWDIYHVRSDFEKALYYIIECVKLAEAEKAKDREHLYSRLGYTYFELGQTDKALEVLDGVIALAQKDTLAIPALVIKIRVKALIEKGRKQEALLFVKGIDQSNKSYRRVDLMVIEEALANCNYALEQTDKAEEHYEKMYAISKSLLASEALAFYISGGQFYYNIKQYDKASEYLNYVLKPGFKNRVPQKLQAEMHWMLYKIDSARTNYQSAIYHLRTQEEIKEQMLNETTKRKVAELEIQYDLEKKNNDLLLKDQSILLKEKNIELLSRQNLQQQIATEQKNKDLLLKQTHIDFLRKETELQKLIAEKNDRGLKLQKKDLELLQGTSALQATALKQAAFIRNVTVAGIVLLVVILLLLYNQYRTKQRNVKEANQRNHTLQGLVQEKEWLVREVHHRVKNNLQIMLSLLESQSAYLQNEALEANLDTLHRIQAMSLIHQRLYQAENISTIDMKVYITELVHYLEDSFGTRKKLVFCLNLVSILLDVSRAVPLGLILNEAITNTIKHAFPESARGVVNVTLEGEGGDRYVLTIADNGCGLPPDFDINTSRSLGARLIKGLSLEINGHLNIHSNGGTCVQVRFSTAMGQVV